jgi:hypothetical protein
MRSTAIAKRCVTFLGQELRHRVTAFPIRSWFQLCTPVFSSLPDLETAHGKKVDGSAAARDNLAGGDVGCACLKAIEVGRPSALWAFARSETRRGVDARVCA